MNIHTGDLRTGIVVAGVVIIYYTFYYIAFSKRAESYFSGLATGDSEGINLFLFRKFSGFFILGVVPAIIYFGLMKASGEKFGLTFSHFSSSYLLIAGLVLVTAVVLYFHHRRNPSRASSQLNPSGWNVQLFMLNLLGWSFYLIAYEFLFRGILLFECYEAMGFWPAVAVNVSLYSAIHMVYGKEQTVGAFIFGSLACYFALTRETLLIPVFMHLSLSIISDFYSIRSLQNPKLISDNQSNALEK